MNNARRPPIITGNWKMHKTIQEAQEFIQQLIPLVHKSPSRVFLAVPFTAIDALAKETENTPLVIGAQNMNDASEGAFTGEVAGKMLKEAGAKFVLLGHSERRHLYHENNDFINRKVKRAIQVGLQPILCIGETKEEYETEQTKEVLQQQLTQCLADISPEDLQTLIVAYEPVWAIGTGYSATPEIAQNVHQFCRQLLGQLLTPELAHQIVIQYGGSANPTNARALLSQPDIDGLLVGGASLSLESFSQIVNDGAIKL